VSATTPKRAELVGTYYANVLALLHVHHEGEDELLWPRLTERRPENAALFATMEEQHAPGARARTRRGRRGAGRMDVRETVRPPRRRSSTH